MVPRGNAITLGANHAPPSEMAELEFVAETAAFQDGHLTVQAERQLSVSSKLAYRGAAQRDRDVLVMPTGTQSR
jgi:hypothetical protein